MANSGTETQKPTCVVQGSTLVLQRNIRVANTVVWKEAKNSRSLAFGGSASHLQDALQILIPLSSMQPCIWGCEALSSHRRQRGGPWQVPAASKPQGYGRDGGDGSHSLNPV